jgi:hypothetical protein
LISVIIRRGNRCNARQSNKGDYQGYYDCFRFPVRYKTSGLPGAANAPPDRLSYNKYFIVRNIYLTIFIIKNYIKNESTLCHMACATGTRTGTRWAIRPLTSSASRTVSAVIFNVSLQPSTRFSMVMEARQGM